MKRDDGNSGMFAGKNSPKLLTAGFAEAQRGQ
jgi:hypothetical protein